MLDSGHPNTAASYRKPKISTTANRRCVTRPTTDRIMLTKKTETVVKRTVKAPVTVSSPATTSRTMTTSRPVASKTTVASRPVASTATRTMRTSATARPAMTTRATTTARTVTPRPTAKELKEEAIGKALAAAAKQPATTKQKEPGVHFGFKRILLALACASAAVFAIVYFVNLNAPNISLKVAAMQTGIEASYPSYVPRDFNLSDITSENGKITLNFKNGSSGDAFSLIEEKSSWDSNALLNNFVKGEYGDNYTVIREQGITLYVGGDGASWVNGGIVYKLKTISGSLTKKQIKAIAVSL